MAGLIFENPEYLWFLFSIPLLILSHFMFLKMTKRKALKFANFDAIERITGKKLFQKNLIALTLRLLALIFMIFAVANVSFWYLGARTDFNYVLAIDTSSSMLAEDFYPNRLEAAKTAASNFVDSIKSRSGFALVSFSGVSKTESVLTSNPKLIIEKIELLTISKVGGTDLGSAIITSANLLVVENKPRILILLTDGQSNVGVPVEEAIKYALENDMRIYTIGIGTEKGGSFAGINITSKIDSETLEFIANNTNGKFYLAENMRDLEDAYASISEVSEEKIRINLQGSLVMLALLLLFIEWGLLNTKLRTIP